MQIKILLLMVLITFMSGFARAHDHSNLCSGFLPPNSMRIPVQNKNATGISKAQYDAILDRAEILFAEDFKNKGTSLEILRNWTSTLVNAFASIAKDGTRTLVMHGGLARHKLMTTEAYALTVCHELGHHLGGAPLRFFWSSLEGQADYYATLKCMRRFFANEDNEKFLAGLVVEPIVKTECENAFPLRSDQLICIRSALAAKRSVEVLKSTTHQNDKFAFNTPSMIVATAMGGTEHPGPQCRLDTYFNGARCAAPVQENVSNDNFYVGTCEANQFASATKRPRCWFFPGN